MKAIEMMRNAEAGECLTFYEKAPGDSLFNEGAVCAVELGSESGPFGHVHCGEKLASRLP